jgi:hypothetical protein
MDALAHVYALLDCTRSDIDLQRWVGTLHRPLYITYQVNCGLSNDDLFLFRKFRLDMRREDPRQCIIMPLDHLLLSNLEICPHVFFGYDCCQGNNELYNALKEFYMRQFRDWSLAKSAGHAWQPEPFTGFVCRECDLEIDMRFHRRDVRITVWKYVGTLRKEKVAWPTKIEKLITSPLARRGLKARVKKSGGLKAGDLKVAWENIPKMNRGSFPPPTDEPW